MEPLRPEKQPKDRYRFLWWGCLYLCMTVGSILALSDTWQGAALKVPVLLCYDVLLMVLGWAAHFRPLKRKRLLGVLPWIALLPLFAVGNPIAGGASWVNSFLQRWNETHQVLVRQISMTASPMDETVFAVLLLTCASQCVAGLLSWKRLGLGLVYILTALFVSLAGMPERGTASALLIMGLLGYLLSGPTLDTSGRAALLWSVAAGVLLLAGHLPGKAIQSVTDFRERTQETVRTLRYGEEQLPLGDLSRAAELKKNRETALAVRSAEEKNLYFTAFTGSSYSGGRWGELPGSAYGGDNTGLFSWLKNRDFLPQTQLARYYSLCENPFPADDVEVRVQSENRYRLYVPASLETIGTGTARFRRDTEPTAKGFFGRRSYRYTERSGTRPGELSLLEGWVANPTNLEQQQYAQSEAEYREFVYENYTQVDGDLNGLMQRIFHREEPESDSVFAVLTHVRDALRQRCTVADGTETPDGEEPIRYFLTESKKGNAMLFASAAVEALRSFGIPARYAEGYYCTAQQLQNAGGETVELSGDAAHAWVEIYFDGMGWVNVDVTPGYYYDLIALQSLVNLPEDVTKTADLSKNDDQAGQLPGDGDGESAGTGETEKHGWSFRWIGLAAIIAVLLLIVLLLTLELGRGIALLLLKRRFAREDALGRAKLMERLLFRVLSGCGIPAGLGWNSQKLDGLLSELFPKIEKGEYLRVCGLLEKAVYGEIAPEVYEERTIVSFLKKLSKVRPGLPLHKRFLARYRWIELA